MKSLTEQQKENHTEEQRAIEEITHILLHGLTEDGIGEKLAAARSQQEAYEVLKTLPYFTLSMDEFRLGIDVLRQEQNEIQK